MTEDRSFDIGDPAPGSSRVGGAALLTAFLLGFVAWSIQLAATSSIAGLACLDRGTGTRAGDSELAWAGPAIAGVNVLALLVALGAIVFSAVLIRRTGEAKHAAEGGVLHSGEGRARFMAVWGLFASLLFLFAIGFNTVSVFWGGLCPA